jgi:uncharacterized damage-inducible protein DinB
MALVERQIGSERAAALAARLREATAGLISILEPIDEARWRHVPTRGVWSISKDAEHIIEAAAYHQWIVRLTIGDPVPKRKPVLERLQMTSDLTPSEAVDLLRQRTEEGVGLLLALTDEQLNLVTRPPRARSPMLEETIERVLIGHYRVHGADIEAKLRAFDR